MHDAYSDIRARIAEEPRWYDLNGVPRYEEPHVPRHLMGRIRCQACGRAFLVSLTDNIYHHAAVRDEKGLVLMGDLNVELDPEKHGQLTEPDDDLGMLLIRKETLPRYIACEHLRLRTDGQGKPTWHYGDPPAHGCVGDTMSSVPEYEWAEWDAEEANDAALA